MLPHTTSSPKRQRPLSRLSQKVAASRDKREQIVLMEDPAGDPRRIRMLSRQLDCCKDEFREYTRATSHDLSAPLRAVAGFANFLQHEYQGQLDDTAKDYVRRIIDGARRMQQKISDLTTFSQLMSHGSQFEQTGLRNSLDDALGQLQGPIGSSAAEVTSDSLPTLVADREQMTLLFYHLIDNSLKFRGPEPPRIHISACQRDREWTISVRDNGMGIAKPYQQTVFQIFRQFHAATQKDPEGSGIGLAICRRIVYRHGGQIWLESGEGRGTTFRFTLSGSSLPG